MLKNFWRDDAPYRVRLRLDPEMAVWIARFFGNCTTSRTDETKNTPRQLSVYSLGLPQELPTTHDPRPTTHDLEYDQRTDEFNHLYRITKSFEATRAAALRVEDPSVRPKPLLEDALLEVEPTLFSRNVLFVGGLHYERDESGDARLFTMEVAPVATYAGEQFQFST